MDGRGPPVTPIDWFRRWLAPEPRGDGWAKDCPAGLPVPEAGRCGAVDCDSMPLTALPLGQRGCVTCLENPGSDGASRLSALGVLPGVEVELLQRFPAFVLKSGYAEIGMDENLARIIRVRRA